MGSPIVRLPPRQLVILAMGILKQLPEALEEIVRRR